MAHGKAPKHDDIVIKFYVHFWEVIGKDYLNMVMNSIEQRKFPYMNHSRSNNYIVQRW